MRKLQRFCAAVVLMLVLTFSAFAGDIQAPGITNTPPPPQQTSITGDILCPGVASTGEIGMPGVVAVDPATGTMLSLLQSVLSFF